MMQVRLVWTLISAALGALLPANRVLCQDLPHLVEQRDASLYRASISGAHAAILTNDIPLCERRLADAPEQLRNWEWHYLSARVGRDFVELRGHTSDVRSVAFSPDGTRLASGSLAVRVGHDSFDREVRIWDVRTGEEIANLRDRERHPIISLCFSPDGERIAAGSYGQNVKIWDLETGDVVATLGDPVRANLQDGHEPSALAFSPDGTHLVSWAETAGATIWNVRTGQEVVALLTSYKPYTTDVSLCPDGLRLVSATSGGFSRAHTQSTIRVRDVQTEEEITVLHVSGRVSRVALSPDGVRLALMLKDGPAKLLDLTTGEDIATLVKHSGPGHSIAFSPDGSHIASGLGGPELKIWNAETGGLTAVMRGHNSKIRSVRYGPTGTSIAAWWEDGKVTIWSTRDLKEIASLSGPLSCFAFSPNGSSLAAGSRSTTVTETTNPRAVRIWDVPAAEHLASLQFHGGRVHSLCFSSDGAHLISFAGYPVLWDTLTGERLRVISAAYAHRTSISPDGAVFASVPGDSVFWKTIDLWDTQTGEKLATLSGHTSPVDYLVFSPKGTRILSWSNRGPDGRRIQRANHTEGSEAIIWSVETGAQIREFIGGVIGSASFSHDETRLALGMADGSIAIMDPRTKQVLRQIRGHKGHRQLIFGPDATRLASVSYHEIKYWNVDTGEELATAPVSTRIHKGVMAFSPHGKLVAIGLSDGRLTLLDANTGQEVALWLGHDGAIYSVAFSPEGSRLASVSADGALKIWDTTTNDHLLTLRSPQTTALTYVVFSPCGTRLASASEEGLITVWDSVLIGDRCQERLVAALAGVK